VLYLSKNTTNRLSVDAPQMAELETPYYFFTFSHLQIQSFYSTYLTRLNPASKRFGEFNLILPSDLDMTSGTYEYKIFESADEISTDTSTMVLLEQGICKVAKAFTPGSFYEPPTNLSPTYGNS